MRKGSLVFTKILLLFLLVILPIYFSSIYVNFIGQKDLEKQIIESVIPKIDFYSNRLEKEFRLTKNNVLNLHTNADLQYLYLIDSNPDDYNRMKAILNTQLRLREIRNQVEFISDITIYIPKIQKKISNTSIQDYANPEFDMLYEVVKNRTSPFVDIDGSKIISTLSLQRAGHDMYMVFSPYFSEILIAGKLTPLYIITLRVDKVAIENMLNELAVSTNGEAILLGKADEISIGKNTETGGLTELRMLFFGEIHDNQPVSKIMNEEINSKKMIIAFKRLPVLDSVLLTYVLKGDFFQSLIRYKAWFWIVTGLTLLLVILFTLLVKVIFIKPLDTLVEGFSHIEEGNLNGVVSYKKHDEFSYLYDRFNNMCLRLKNLIEQIYEQKILTQKAELKQLQYQINPHFLYNSLFIIYRMAKMGNIDGILKMSMHLGSYYQFVTKTNSDEVALISEINHINDYIQIQSIRFEERIIVHIQEITSEVSNLLVPRLILQPLVENAYNHGLQNKKSGGMIWIRFIYEDHILRLNVEDNGEKLEPESIKKIQESLLTTDHMMAESALVNINRRLKIKYGDASGISSEIGSHGGMNIEIRIAY